MIVIGICGLPAGGKSAVAETLQQFGAVWINADQIAHQVLDVAEVQPLLVRQFGTAILREDGKIDRPRLGAIVFGDDAPARAALRYLESVVHPPTRTMIIQQITAALQHEAVAVVLDIPLLLESQWDLWCDEIWYVDTAESLRLTAAAQRGWTAEMLKQRTARQMHADEKRRLSTRLIPNHATLEQLRRQVASAWQQLFEHERSGTATRHCRDRLLGAQSCG